MGQARARNSTKKWFGRGLVKKPEEKKKKIGEGPVGG